MGSTGRYGDEQARRRRARRLSGRDANRLPPQLLHALNAAGRRRGKGHQGLFAASGGATLFGAIGGNALVAGLLGLLLFALSAASAYAYLSKDLPDVHQFETRPFGTTRIYDRNGRLLNEVSDPELGWRTNVTIEQVSPHVVAATLAAEDPSFMTNNGVDPMSIVRAAIINYNGEGRSGGSTITQQLVRSLYPEAIGTNPTLTRKGREALVAISFAKTYPKEQVLALYLNEIYYGNRSYGIDAAAQSYFNKRAKDLDLAEASILAGLPQAPSYFDPRHNFEGAKIRQRYVLEQMIKTGAIDRTAAQAAWAQPLLPLTREGRYNDAPHFVNYVRDYIEEKYGAGRLYRGDLQIYTTLDYEAQKAGERIVRAQVQQLRAKNVTNGALVAILPATGEILTMVGSADYYDDAIDGQVNVTTRERQPGSSIKPVAYAAAFEKGWSPATKVMDVKSVYPVTSRAYAELEALRGQGRDLPPERERDTTSFYVPDNHDYLYHGAVSTRDALARSMNIPAVKAIQYAGIDQVIDTAHKMGIRSGLWRGANYYGFTLSLGGGEVQPLEHTNVYATFANGGRYVPLTPILKIIDGTTGQTIAELDRKGALAEASQALAPEIAYQITSIITDNEARTPDYGANNALILPELGRPVGAKTGTTSDYRDTWTMGYTTDLAVGVWVGNSNNTEMDRVLGAAGPAPIWHNFMVEVHQRPELARHLLDPDGQPYPLEFARPAGLIEAEVCLATGKPLSASSGGAPAGSPVSAPAGPAARPGGRTRRDLFVPSQMSLPCDQLTPEENDELTIALRSIGRDAAKFAPGTTQSVLDYRAAARNYRPLPSSGVTPALTPPPRRR